MDDSVYWQGRTYSRKQIKALKDNNFKNISSSKLKFISKMGGVASGIARRKKRDEREAIKRVLHQQLLIDEITEKELEDFISWQKNVKKMNPERTTSEPRK